MSRSKSNVKDTILERSKKDAPYIEREAEKSFGPKPNARELALAREGELDQAIALMAKRTKSHPVTARLALRPYYKHVRMPVAIDGLFVSVDHNGELVVKVAVDGLEIPVITGSVAHGGLFGHYTSAGGIRSAIHREVEGCDERVIMKGRKIVGITRCTKRGSCQ